MFDMLKKAVMAFSAVTPAPSGSCSASAKAATPSPENDILTLLETSMNSYSQPRDPALAALQNIDLLYKELDEVPYPVLHPR